MIPSTRFYSLGHKSETPEEDKVIALAAFIFLFLTYANFLFYTMYHLPIGMVDVDRYLYGVEHLNEYPANLPTHIIFYYLISALGSPAITFLWLPPLLCATLTYLAFQIYQPNGRAFLKTMAFTFMTSGIWFYFICSLWRQLLAMTILVVGVWQMRRHPRIALLLLLLAIAIHIDLIPIIGLYLLADLIRQKRSAQISALLVIGAAVFLLVPELSKGLALIGGNQPSFYTLLFISTNPLLWVYGYKRLRWQTKDIFYILLTVLMPFADQGRGMIFLQFLLVDYAIDNYLETQQPTRQHLLLLFLSYLWWNYMTVFLIKSMILNAAERSLNFNAISQLFYITP